MGELQVEEVGIMGIATGGAEDIARRLRAAGYNIIPIVAGTKVPPKNFDLSRYFTEMCAVPITDRDSIGMIHGYIGGTWAVDVDLQGNDGGAQKWRDALAVIASEPEKVLQDMLVVRTPRQGCHLICKGANGVYPPANISYLDKAGNKIDIKTQGGYTIVPPSVHPLQHLGRYKFVSAEGEDTRGVDWYGFEAHLATRGFFTNAQKMETGHGGRKYEFTDLLAGNYKRGTRRVKQKSLYVQKRAAGSSEREASTAVRRINAGCRPPIDDAELEANILSAEAFYCNVVQPEMEQARTPKKVKNKEASVKEEKENDESAPAAGTAAGARRKKKIPDGHDDTVGATAVGGKKSSNNNNNKSATGTSYKRLDPYAAADVLLTRNLYATTEQELIYWKSGGVYKKYGQHMISQECRLIWREMGIETPDIREITHIVMDATGYIRVDDFDADPNVLNLLNGTYHIGNDVFQPEGYLDPAYRSLTQYHVQYERGKKCPRFLKFLSTSLDHDPVRICTVLEMMALCFIPASVVEKAFMHTGTGSNGKSVILNILTDILGIENITAKPIHSFEHNRFAGADLEGKAANISADVGKKGIRDTELIKKLIGGDPIDCEQKFKGSYAMRPHATLIFSANELPEVDDSSDGFARKFELIRWDHQWYGTDRDHTVKTIRHDPGELSGILNLLIPIMLRLLRTHTLRYESTVEMTRNEWVRESDSIAKFVEGNITRENDAILTKEYVYAAYVKYCSHGKYRARSRVKFNTRMGELGFISDVRRIAGRSTRVWVGGAMKDGGRNSDGRPYDEGDGQSATPASQQVLKGDASP